MAENVRQTNCLRDALRLIMESDLFEQDVKESINDRMSRLIDETKNTPDEQFAKSMAAFRGEKSKALRNRKHRLETDQRIAQNQITESAIPAENIGTWLRAKESALLRLSEIETEAGRAERVQTRFNIYESQISSSLSNIIDSKFARAGYVRETQHAQDVRLELYGGESGSKLAKEHAAEIRRLLDELHQELIDQGYAIPYRKDYLPQIWDISRVAADRPGLIKLFEDHLDKSQFPDPASAADDLYNSLTTDRFGGGAFGNSLLQERIFQMTFPEGELLRSQLFGSGTLFEDLQQYLLSASRHIELAADYGPSPRRGFRASINSAQEAIGNLRRRAARENNRQLERIANRQAEALTETERAFEAQINPPVNALNQTWANLFAATDGWVRAMVLGKIAYFHMTTDPALALQRIMLNNGGEQGVGDFLNAMAGGMGPGRLNQFAQDYGAGHVFSGIHASSALRTTGEKVVLAGGDRTSRAIQATAKAGLAADRFVQRVSFAHQMRERLKASTAFAHNRMIRRHAMNFDWDRLPSNFRRLIGNNGFNRSKWNRLKENLENYVDPQTGTIDIGKLPKDLKSPFATHIYIQQQISQANPLFSTRLSMGAYLPEAGIPDILARRFKMFLASPWSILQANLGQSFQLQGFPGATTALASMAIGGLMYTQLRSLVDTGEVFAWDNKELWVRSVLASGMMIPVAEQVFRDAALNENAANTIPQFGVVQRVGETGWEVIKPIMDDDIDAAKFEAFNAVNALPNIWWIQGIHDRAMVDAASTLNPDYARYRRRRAQEKLEGVFD